eukprot:CAMPEP_0117495592 /NCGR_PEP_ID=MMETSP0784-20121206/20212_1 /TAXON_ID=39447 /ORGANISM="" /LENGTH=144 /DNA_ID=CAMNT_0005290519 /DNA_START=403 /DNA_END=837 /DNA_ORIENTATION=+
MTDFTNNAFASSARSTFRPSFVFSAFRSVILKTKQFSSFKDTSETAGLGRASSGNGGTAGIGDGHNSGDNRGVSDWVGMLAGAKGTALGLRLLPKELVSEYTSGLCVQPGVDAEPGAMLTLDGVLTSDATCPSGKIVAAPASPP